MPHHTSSPALRLRYIYILLTVIFGIFIARAFYMQVIRHDHYKNRALSTQLKQYEIPAERGTILVHDGENLVSLVLNQKLYTVYADPSLIKKDEVTKVAESVAKDIGGTPTDIAKQLSREGSRYEILGRRVSLEQKDALLKHKYAGIGAQQQTYRTYPQGVMAAQLLGIVDDSGTGRYGIEQALNKKMTGTPGELKAVTDIKGVPLAANKDNTLKNPIQGMDTVLTLDIGMQKQLETILVAGAQKSRAEQASAIIMDVNTGAVKAMANYPSYDPAQSGKVEDANLFNNAAVSQPIEVGSIMKSLTVAAGLDSGVANRNTSYFDPAKFVIDEATVKNVEEDGGPGTKTMFDLLNLSLNTGAAWVLMQMGDGELNSKARTQWYDYMHERYRFGKETGIEQGFEAPGYMPGPTDTGSGINLTYANTAFGQAMTATPLQMVAAMSAIMNGGTYYQPHLVDYYLDADGKKIDEAPKVLQSNVVKPSVATDLSDMLVYSVENHPFNPQFDQSRYTVGGKTGTAEAALPEGGYSKTDFNGTYLGFVGGDKPQYAIVVFTIKPKVAGYAGTTAAQPIFGSLAHMLINNSYVTPKR